MKSTEPQIIVPYHGPTEDPHALDIFIYMRPETNGTLGESVVTKVIENCPEYRTEIKLVYMVNIPGECIVEDHLIERYNALKIYFARSGASALTHYMRTRFEQHFRCDWKSAQIIGAYEALRLLNCNESELFDIWVDEKSVLDIHGQTIKKIDNLFVINYDVPALLKKNNSTTDIAVMLFRMQLPYKYINSLAARITTGMVEQRILPTGSTPSRAFHYSGGPFEQLRDGLVFLFGNDKHHCPLETLSFGRYLLTRNIDEKSIQHLVDNPLVTLRDHHGALSEASLFMHTRSCSYRQAHHTLENVVSQSLINI